MYRSTSCSGRVLQRVPDREHQGAAVELCFALFNRIYLCEEGVVRCDLATPYAQILDPDLPERLEADKAVIAEGRLRDLLAGDGGQAPGAADDERPDHGGRGVSNSSRAFEPQPSGGPPRTRRADRPDGAHVPPVTG